MAVSQPRKAHTISPYWKILEDESALNFGVCGDYTLDTLAIASGNVDQQNPILPGVQAAEAMKISQSVFETCPGFIESSGSFGILI